ADPSCTDPSNTDPSSRQPQPKDEPAIQPESPSRRSFLGKLGGAAATALTVGGITVFEPAIAGKAAEARADDIGPLTDAARQQAAATLRTNLANHWGSLSLTGHPTNGDETLYPDLGASYSKCLPHDNYGRVNLSAYSAYINALTTGSPSAFQAIPLGGGGTLTNPQAGLAYTLEGNDSHNMCITQ